LTAAGAKAQAQRVQSFYDEWSPAFVRDFGTTLQAGFVKSSAESDEDADTSSLLLAHRAGVKEGDRILDAGCGVGGPAIAIARGYSRARVHGITISSVQADLGRQFIVEAGVADRVTIVQADCHCLPFPDQCFDVAVFFESCGYSTDRARLFAETARVVRRGGLVYVKDVFAQAGSLTDDEARTLAAFDDQWRLASSPTLPEVAAAFEGAGCAVVTAGEIPHVGTDRFFTAMFEPDPDALFRLSDLGRAFSLSGPCPTFFGEVLARRRE
jgi:cyclopropane fatty-acyl-phospholipid synthase-like methyltransferase